MATTNKVILTLSYSDETTRDVQITGVKTADLANVKQKVFDFNVTKCGVANELTGDKTLTADQTVTKTFVSDDGADLVEISAAKIVSETTTSVVSNL